MGVYRRTAETQINHPRQSLIDTRVRRRNWSAPEHPLSLPRSCPVSSRLAVSRLLRIIPNLQKPAPALHSPRSPTVYCLSHLHISDARPAASISHMSRLTQRRQNRPTPDGMASHIRPHTLDFAGGSANAAGPDSSSSHTHADSNDGTPGEMSLFSVPSGKDGLGLPAESISPARVAGRACEISMLGRFAGLN